MVVVFQGHAALIINKFFLFLTWKMHEMHLKTCDRILFTLIAWSASESACTTCTDLPFAALTRSAPNMLVILTGGGTDKLLISASPLLPQDKLAAAVIRAFEWILSNNKGRLPLPLPVTQCSLCTVYLFIYLLFLSLDKTVGNKTDWKSFCFHWKKSSMQKVNCTPVWRMKSFMNYFTLAAEICVW